jgi:D-alanine-D-alanine ligase
MAKKQLAVFFGGISPEHEVSVITGVQLMKHVDSSRYDLIPVYIDKAGGWWTGEQLTTMEFYKNQDLFKPSGATPFTLNLNRNSNEIDVAILCFHGQYGEGGNVQGALELAGIPYQGPAVTSSAICFDKIILRQILTAEGIGQPDYRWFTKQEWHTNKAEIENKVNQLQYPLFVKPANGGSTIGIQKIHTPAELAQAVEVVVHYDDRVLIEAAITECIEVNVSVLGYEGHYQTSVPEQPLSKDEFLSFADKYERGGGKKSGMASATRRIPAPISNSLTQKLQDLAKKVAHTLDCSGVIRIDFFVNPSTEEMFVIEPNTIPGSMSFYLWEATGIKYPALIDSLVEIAEAVYAEQQQLTTTFTSQILNKSIG